MSLPFYVGPEQVMRDRAEYARKGIARGRTLVAVEHADGVVFAAENPSRALDKTSEVHDRVAFAAVGRYNEFESLRVAGIRMADLKALQYSREDVDVRPLANAYAQALGAVFTGDGKPFEVELLVAGLRRTEEHGADAAPTGALELFHIRFDGSIEDVRGHVAVGGDPEPVAARLGATWRPGLDLDAAVRCAVAALRGAEAEPVSAAGLEVSGLDASRGRRCFFRLDPAALSRVLGV